MKSIFTCIAALGLYLFAQVLSFAQPNISGRISGGFQAPASTDDQGRRHVLKGSSAESRGNNSYELTDPRVTSFNADDTPDMFIESPRCIYETKSNLAYSDAILSVRTADGRFSIKGRGWRWDPSSAGLSISNAVVAYVARSALATNLASNAKSTGTNEPVQITSNFFRQEGDNASFLENVLVRDGKDTLRGGQLLIEFVKPGGVQKVEAVENVELVQGETKVESGRAVYDLRENVIRISESPRWSSEMRAGSADLLVLNRTEKKLLAEGNVYMKLPLTNVSETVVTNAATTRTNRFLEIYSGQFHFTEATTNRRAEARYENNVRVKHLDASITSELLKVDFDSSNRVRQITAQRSVRIESGGNQAFGEMAEYDMLQEKIVLTGEPHWKMDNTTGRSERLVFFPKTGEVLALHDAEMTIPGQAAGALFSVNVRTNHAGATNVPMIVRSETFSHGKNVSVFHGNVRLVDARGKISCQLVTVVTGASNQVERIIAERDVRIEQGEFVATGSRAEYDVRTGLVHLTGDPELVGDGKRLRSSAFLINRNDNTFSVTPGKYRIELKLKERGQEGIL